VKRGPKYTLAQIATISVAILASRSASNGSKKRLDEMYERLGTGTYE